MDTVYKKKKQKSIIHYLIVKQKSARGGRFYQDIKKFAIPNFDLARLNCNLQNTLKMATYL